MDRPASRSVAVDGIEEDVALDRGDGRLSGTLVCPGPPGTPRTVVLIVAGSGPTDRDGNGTVLGLRTDCLKQLAAGLAGAGIAFVHGCADAQVDVDEARRLASAGAGARVAIVDGMDHVLKRPGPDPADRAASYTDATRPLAPGLLDAIRRFVDSVR